MPLAVSGFQKMGGGGGTAPSRCSRLGGRQRRGV